VSCSVVSVVWSVCFILSLVTSLFENGNSCVSSQNYRKPSSSWTQCLLEASSSFHVDEAMCAGTPRGNSPIFCISIHIPAVLFLSLPSPVCCRRECEHVRAGVEWTGLMPMECSDQEQGGGVQGRERNGMARTALFKLHCQSRRQTTEAVKRRSWKRALLRNKTGAGGSAPNRDSWSGHVLLACFSQREAARP